MIAANRWMWRCPPVLLWVVTIIAFTELHRHGYQESLAYVSYAVSFVLLIVMRTVKKLARAALLYGALLTGIWIYLANKEAVLNYLNF